MLVHRQASVRLALRRCHIRNGKMRALVAFSVLVTAILVHLNESWAVPIAQINPDPTQAVVNIIPGGGGAEVWGFRFTTNLPLLVTDLGIFDLNDDGLTTAHSVGLWTDSGSLIASATVGPGTGDTLLSGFRYTSISPVTLSAGGTFRIAVSYPFFSGAPTDLLDADLGALGSRHTFDPAITWLSPARARGEGLVFPSDTSPIVLPGFINVASALGPNFQFSVAPPPQSDLVVENLSVNPTSDSAGSQVIVSFGIRNQGIGAANASTTNIRLAASSTDVTTSDPLLASISTPSIAGGDTFTVSQPVTIPAVDPGSYFVWVIVDVNNTANQSDTTNDRVNTGFTITPGPPPRLPVILVHGWCGSPDSFGMMGEFLQQDLNLVNVYPFNFSSPSSIPPSERGNLKRLAARLAREILQEMQERGVTQVDVVSHSTGGILVRAWMAGLTEVPYTGEIRGLVLAGSPNFGVPREFLDSILFSLGFCAEEDRRVMRLQAEQLFFGSEFLTELNTKWRNAVGSKVRPPAIMTIVGCGFTPPGEECLSDLVVPEASATLPVESPDYHVRYVNRLHFNSLVDIDSRDHETYQLVKGFLDTGSAGSFYDAIVIRGLIAVPLIKDPISQEAFTDKGGVFFGRKTAFGRLLPHCQDFTLNSPFTRNKPFDRTGLWTLTDVLEGCWLVQVNSSKFISSELQVNVVRGRPTMTVPLVVVRKR